MCVITAYSVQCLVAGCRGSGAGQQGVRPERGMLHFYAHHQELETICVLLPPVVCSVWLLVVGGSGAGQQAMRSGRGMFRTAVVKYP